MTKLSRVVALVAACALAGAAVAVAARGHGKMHLTAATTTGTTAAPMRPPHTPEPPLTGDALTKASAAAIAKVGGTVDAAVAETDGTNAAAKYEVHVTKADGTHVTVIEDASYAVLSVETGGPGFGPHGFGPPGFGPPGGRPGNGETPLTGDIATQAKAAAVAKVGGTADLATTETDGSTAAAKYEVHVTKADGTHVTVIEDASYAVLSVETGGPGGPPGNH
jgi:uncharacterized membrane protein YkoI